MINRDGCEGKTYELPGVGSGYSNLNFLSAKTGSRSAWGTISIIFLRKAFSSMVGRRPRTSLCWLLSCVEVFIMSKWSERRLKIIILSFFVTSKVRKRNGPLFWSYWNMRCDEENIINFEILFQYKSSHIKRIFTPLLSYWSKMPEYWLE